MEEEQNQMQKDGKMTNCKTCGKVIAKNAKVCPYCGGKNKKPLYKRISFWVIVAVLVFFMIPGSDEEDTTEAESAGSEVEESVDAEEAAEPEEPAEPEVPREYISALHKAETCSSMMHMSKKGIYEQLTSEYGEQFPAEAAQYAVDNLVADYNLNALEKAKTYRDSMDMSKNAIYDQLISEYGEQFTAEEAQYAVDHLGE